MIPYLHIPVISIGPIAIHTWGLFVSLGFLVGLWLARQEAKRRGLATGKVVDLCFWIIVGAFLGARLAHVLFYEPSFYLARPLEILKIWQGGLSSFGGFFGAVFAGWLYLKKQKLNFWQWADVIAFALPLGWGIGRLGCFLTHLHHGIKSNFFLAVNFPDGPRLEMGLLEALFSLLLFGYFLLMRRRLRFAGFYLINFVLIYGVWRFFADFLRAQDIAGADIRYFGLTPAQYGSLIFAAAGLYWWLKRNTDSHSSHE